MFLFFINQVVELILPRQFLQNMSKHSIITVFQESYVYSMKFHLMFMPLNHNLEKFLPPPHFVAIGCQVLKYAKNGS